MTARTLQPPRTSVAHNNARSAPSAVLWQAAAVLWVVLMLVLSMTRSRTRASRGRDPRRYYIKQRRDEA